MTTQSMSVAERIAELAPDLCAEHADRLPVAQAALEAAVWLLQPRERPGLYVGDDDHLEARWIVGDGDPLEARVVSITFGPVVEGYVYDRATGKVALQQVLDEDGLGLSVAVFVALA